MTHKKIPATTGGSRLRAMREAAGMTQLQLELEASLGIGYLQRLELGKVTQPTRETLERILSALQVGYAERRDILWSFGYTIEAAVPDAQDTQRAVESCRAELERATFPAYVLDCRHRLITWNGFVPRLYQSLAHLPEKPLMPKMMFDPAFGIAPRIANPDSFYPSQIRVLRFEMQRFQDAVWNQAFLDEMLKIRDFKKYWAEATPAQIPIRPLTLLQLKLAEGGIGGIAQFHLACELLHGDPRFRIIYYMPADADTFRWCAA